MVLPKDQGFQDRVIAVEMKRSGKNSDRFGRWCLAVPSNRKAIGATLVIFKCYCNPFKK